MYAYCNNNPINSIDPDGNIVGVLAGIAGVIGSVISGIASAIGAIVSSPVVIAAGALIAAAGIVYGSYTVTTAIIKSTQKKTTASSTTTKTTTATTTKTVTTTTNKNNEDTVIYRYGGANPGNLTPTKKDVITNTGLSFSTIPKPGATMTTIKVVNATGILYAKQDGLTHVSVYPVGGTTKDWYNAGSNSIWTQTLKSVVIKWDGVN